MTSSSYPMGVIPFAQFLLFRQGKRLREYSRAAGVRLIMKVQEKDPKMVEGFTPDQVGAVAKQALNRCRGKGRLNG